MTFAIAGGSGVISKYSIHLMRPMSKQAVSACLFGATNALGSRRYRDLAPVSRQLPNGTTGGMVAA